jgi:hypothetical protein
MKKARPRSLVDEASRAGPSFLACRRLHLSDAAGAFACPVLVVVTHDDPAPSCQ